MPVAVCSHPPLPGYLSRPCPIPQSIARSFGFAVPPRVNLNIESKASHARKAVRAKAGGGGGDKRGTGHSFSASNPYGKRAAGDTRQFIRG